MLYQEEYHEIAEISDARLRYFDHNQTLLSKLSWRKTIGLGKGKYVLFVSDEDDILLESLEYYLAVLRAHLGLPFISAMADC